MTESAETLRTREIPLADLRKLAAEGHIYAIVDACNVPTAPKKALDLGSQRAVSLYRGSAEQDFWDVAPYLLKVDEEVVDWILANSSTEGWGIFVASKADLESLRLHLRHFLKVQSPKGEIWFFRFYDPRVLKPFLASCSRDELYTLFGPVLAFGTTQPEAETVVFVQQTARLPWDRSSAGSYSFMFTLTPAHVAALEPQAEADFVRRLTEHLREERVAGAQDPDQATFLQRVHVGLSRARRYGITWEYNLVTFVKFMFMFAPNFDEHPHVRRILNDRGLDRERVIDVIVSELSEEEWQGIEQDRDDSAWKRLGSESTNA
jgi:hypothetical protein